jgi:putative transposase
MPMRGPKPPAITLTEVERQELQRLIKRHTTPQQIALRARLILAAADGLNNAQVAHQEAVSVDTARHWRTRWLESRSVALRELSVKERLADAPRSGKPPTITDEQVCQIVALACEAPTQSGRPITQWSGREIAEEIKRRGIVERISGRHAARLLKRGISSRTESATG